MLVKNDYTTQISFGSLRQKRIFAEQILNEHLKSVPVTKSNSKLNAKIIQHCEQKEYRELLPWLYNASKQSNEVIHKYREQLRKNSPFKSYDIFIEKVKESVLNSHHANCAEKNYLLQNTLIKKGVKAHAVHIASTKPQTSTLIKGKDHTFLVFKVKNGAKLDDPATWGTKAIVVDADLKIVKLAKDAIEYYKQFFSMNEQKERIIFKNADKIKLNDSVY